MISPRNWVYIITRTIWLYTCLNFNPPGFFTYILCKLCDWHSWDFSHFCFWRGVFSKLNCLQTEAVIHSKDWKSPWGVVICYILIIVCSKKLVPVGGWRTAERLVLDMVPSAALEPWWAGGWMKKPGEKMSSSWRWAFLTCDQNTQFSHQLTSCRLRILNLHNV